MSVAQSCLTLCDPVDTPGAHQAPLSMEFSRQEYWSRLPFSSPGDLPDSAIKPRFPASQADSLLSEPPGKAPNKARCVQILMDWWGKKEDTYGISIY